MAAEAAQLPGPTSRAFEQRVRLELAMGVAITTNNPLGCEAAPLAPGTRIISGGDWEILAWTTEGGPISVGVSRDGKLVAGNFNLELACPCLSQP